MGLNRMTKCFTFRLETWLKEKKEAKRRQDVALPAFLLVREEVKAAMKAGRSLKKIWRQLQDEGKIQYRYDTFCKHARRHLDTDFN